MLTPANESVQPINSDQYMEAKTAFLIAQARYRQTRTVTVDFVLPTYDNIVTWKKKMSDLGYQVKSPESTINGVNTYEVSW